MKGFPPVAGVAGQDAGRVDAETEAAGAGERGSRGAVIRSSRSVSVALVSRPGVEGTRDDFGVS